jgi:hypothetical protein
MLAALSILGIYANLFASIVKKRSRQPHPSEVGFAKAANASLVRASPGGGFATKNIISNGGSTMPKVNTEAKVKIAPRIRVSVESEIRRISQEDYNRPDRISQVIEDAVTHYSASRQNGNQLEQVLSATEGALLNRVSEKFEKEFQQHINRVGDLIAKQSYYAIYSAMMSEELLRQILRKDSKFKEIRDKRWNKAHEILEGHYEQAGDSQPAYYVKENEELREQNEKLRGEVQRLQEELNAQKERSAKLAQLTEKAKNLAKETDQYYLNLLKWIAAKQEKTTFGNKYTIPDQIEKLVNEYRSQYKKGDGEG